MTGPSQVEDKRDAHYEDLNELITKHSYGRHVVPVVLLQSPEEKFRARIALQENVDALATSMMTFGSVNEHVEVVLFVSGNKPLPSAAGFKVPQTSDEMKARGLEGFYTIVGDHTQKALNQLHRQFSGNPKWASTAVTLYIFHRTPEAYSSLKSWGILDNIKGEKRVTVSFQDKIQALHEDFLSLQEHESTPGHKERTLQVKDQRRKDLGDISSGQMMQLWSIACRTGRVWELLLKIITGDVIAPKQSKVSSTRRAGRNRSGLKVVKSAANFTNIGGIDDNLLVPLLEAVVNGHASLQKLNDQCALLKARMRVQTAVLTDSNVETNDWCAAEVKFPLATHVDFVERWAVALVREGLKARAALPAAFFTELDRRVSSDMQPKAAFHAAVSSRAININGSALHVLPINAVRGLVCDRRCCPRPSALWRALCTTRKSGWCATT